MNIMAISRGRTLLRCLVLTLVLLFASSARSAGDQDPDSDPLRPYRGVVSGLLADFRDGDETARQKASGALLGRGEYVLPYVLVAAEATPDEGYRARLLALAAEIRAGLPEPSRVSSFRRDRDLPGYSEYSPWDVVAGNLVKNRWRADAARLSLFALPPGPESALLHIDAERWSTALLHLIAFARAHPDRVEEALAVARWSNICDNPELAARMAVLEEMATAIMESTPPERASLIAFHLANLLRPDRAARLAAVAKAWGEEEGGLRARHALIQDSGRPGRVRLEEQLDLCAKYPGREATRLGLENAVFQLGFNLGSKEFGPLPRLRVLAAVAARLMSDEFASGEGCYRATLHLADFYLPRDIAPEEARELLAAYRVFFAHHFLVDALCSPAVGFDYYLQSKFSRLHEVLGVERESLGPVLLAELESIEGMAPEKAPVRCFMARLLAEQGRIDEALAILEDLQDEFPDRFYGRKALATQATLLYAGDEFSRAGQLYARYANEHPTSAYAWVAALRAGHALALGGDWSGAVAAWELARAEFPGHPLMAVLVPLSLGRAFEEQGVLTEALAQYRSALAAWPHGCDDELGTPLTGIGPPKRLACDPDAVIGREDLAAKLSELDRPGIDPAELSAHLKARREKERGEAAAAVARWRELLDAHPDSPLAPEVRSALGRTLIEMAFAANARAPAERFLVAAATGGDRFSAFSVELIRAIADLGVEGGEEVAAERLARALDQWERGTPPEEPGTDLLRDVAAIRRAAFRPRDSAYFNSDYHPESWPRYTVVSPEIELVFPDGRKETVSLRQAYPEVRGVVSFSQEELSFLASIIDRLGGDRRTKPEWIMALPQPEGAAKVIGAFLNRFIRLTPGHWGGWHLCTYPILSTIRFQDAERTAAIVEFRVAYQGGEAHVGQGVSGKGDWELSSVSFTWME